MITAIIEAIKTRRAHNRLKRQLRCNATSRAIINLVASGALTPPQAKRLLPTRRCL